MSLPFQDWTHIQGDKTTLSRLKSAAGTVPFWGDSPESWDTILFNNLIIPGVCKVGGKAFELRADRKKTPGNTETLTTLGREPAEPELCFRIYTAEHLTAFQKIIRSFLPKGSKELGAPVDVIHPALALYRIKSLRVMTATFPEEREPQVYEVKLKCREFRRGEGTPTTAKSSRSITDAGGPGGGAVPALLARPSPADTNGNAPRTGGAADTGGYDGIELLDLGPHIGGP